MKTRLLNISISPRTVSTLEAGIIILLAIVPAFFNLPYRDNIYLTWEGAYRMYLGQVPFKDFGLPMGYGFWIIPTLFFKLFGPYLHTLIKAQVIINIISGLAFRSILKSLEVNEGVRLLSVFIYVISFSFLNFWPWYNHTVIVFEFVGLAFLLQAFKVSDKKVVFLLLPLSALFLFLSFFTKQDGGAFAILIGGTLMLFWAVLNRKYIHLLVFAVSMVIVAGGFILPLLPYDFSYWFNYGQPPHNSRVSVQDISNEVFGASQFLKLYVLLIGLIVLVKFQNFKAFFQHQTAVLFLLLTLAIMFQAFILQVTSYVPRDGNIYFHSFACAYILSNIPLKIDFTKVKYLVITSLLIVFWWSGIYWKYANRIMARFIPETTQDQGKQNAVGISSFTINRDSTLIDQSKWVVGKEKEIQKIRLPVEALEAIASLKEMPIFGEGKNPKVLNMSEYTPLASILGYELEVKQPLWYHLNVAMFEKEMQFFEQRITNEYYDLVLFEVIPDLNNFYPFGIREVLQEHYKMINQFQAPRDKTYEVVEVYVRKADEAKNK